MDFIAALSKKLLTDKEFKSFPELSSLGFWMRHKNLLRMKENFEQEQGNRVLLPRGTVFHIAPSNVDTIFVYSWLLSMLCGNRNIVRISTRLGEQVDLLIRSINEILKETAHAKIGNLFRIVRYPHSDEVTARFSAMCDMRMIWGGDETIRRIRSVPLPPTAKEITFADKFSFSVVDAANFLAHPHKQKLLWDFYNDAFWFGQLACSSPRVVFWLGDEISVKGARAVFWKMLDEIVCRKNPDWHPSVVMDKLVAQYSQAARSEGAVIEQGPSNRLNRIWIERKEEIRRDYHCGGGLFIEHRLERLSRLAPWIIRKDQTITAFGVSKERWEKFFRKHLPEGIDRVVPFGKALQFSVTWDGYDLFREFTREVTVS
jgi:hypothetical protein